METTVQLTPVGDWLVLDEPTEAPIDDPLNGQLGLPGLWKLVRGPEGLRRIFELPASALAGAADPEDGDPRQACADWALATAAGNVPPDWEPPPFAEVERLIPIGRLTVQLGPLLRQGELLNAPGRLALRFPVVTAIPSGLSEARRAWLLELLAEAQDHWRMVRIGLTEDGTAARAEVDLSGCPHMVLEGLFRTGLDALRWVVEWLVRSADFLADADADCRAVEVWRVRAQPAERLVSHG